MREHCRTQMDTTIQQAYLVSTLEQAHQERTTHRRLDNSHHDNRRARLRRVPPQQTRTIMSIKLLPGCRVRGCINRALPRATRCALHQRPETARAFARNKATAMRTGRAGTADGFYRTKTWQNLRRLHLHTEPTCRTCGAPADMVDHVVPLHEGGEALDMSNLQSLCNHCHAVKRGQEGARAAQRNLKNKLNSR